MKGNPVLFQDLSRIEEGGRPKSIYSSVNMGNSMAKTPTNKSEPVKTYHEEEEKENVAPTTPLNEEPAMNKEPESIREPVKEKPQDSTESGVDTSDEEYEMAVKAINDRFDRIEATQKSMVEILGRLEKANYTSKPKSRESDYPTPPDDGPIGDGIQAPRITQSKNPASKPFGKMDEGTKTALGGAAEGHKELPMNNRNERQEALESILKGTKKLVEVRHVIRKAEA
jgi:hypothetical protein